VVRRETAAVTHVVEHVRPALHGDALEDGEHGEQDVVELRDAVVRSDPVPLAQRAVGTQPRRQHRAARQAAHHLPWKPGDDT